MISKKMFRIDEAWFNLPDDFDGTCGEALMLFAKYRLEQEKNYKGNIIKFDVPEDMLDAFIKSDKKGAISYSIQEFEVE